MHNFFEIISTTFYDRKVWFAYFLTFYDRKVWFAYFFTLQDHICKILTFGAHYLYFWFSEFVNNLSFFSFFEIICVISAFGAVSVRNPVQSVLLLVFVFLNAAVLFIRFHSDFLAFVLVVVYVGAVAVLFLFVVMLFDIRLRSPFLLYSSTQKFDKKILSKLSDFFIRIYTSFSIRYNLVGIVGIVIFVFFFKTLVSRCTYYGYPFFWAKANIYTVSYLSIFGVALFNYYFVYLIVVSLILLVVLIGCIVLTSNDVVQKESSSSNPNFIAASRKFIIKKIT